MTPAQQTEWNYVYTERLGILCGNQQPTREQEQIARAEADRAVKKMEPAD